MKLWLVGLWVTLVALATTYGVAVSLPPPGAAPKPGGAAVLMAQKSRVISVPMIADGSPQGYITMQFAYTVDGELLKSMKVPPEMYLVDEAFRAVYNDETLDFNHLERYDLNKLTSHVVKSTNERLGVDVIKDVLIDNFAYIPRDAKD